jgi:hypothetical protein
MEFRKRNQVEKLELQQKMFELRLKYIEEILLESIVKMNDLEIDHCELSKSLSNSKINQLKNDSYPGQYS